jgi:hypothetical protein
MVGGSAEIAPCRLSLVDGVELPENRLDGVRIAPCFVIEPRLDELPLPVSRLVGSGYHRLMKDAPSIAVGLSTPERVLLFCVASGTEWAQAGVTGATATAMLVRGLVERDALGRLQLTSEGRAVLDALLQPRRPSGQ